MKHIEKALIDLRQSNPSVDWDKFIEIGNSEDLPLTIKFTIQSAPMGEVGVNGLQATDILEYIKFLFASLNKEFGCRENSLTITKIEEALLWQYARTKDRVNRGVEGINKA